MSDPVVSGAPAAPAQATDPKAQDPGLVQETPNTGASGGAAPNLTKEAAAEVMRKHKLKVDGQEIEVDEEELKRGYSHQKAANKILQEGKAAKKQATEFIEKMKDRGSLFEVIQKLGHDPRKLAEEYLAAQLEDELLDPREKDLRSAQARLKQYEELEKKQKEEVERQRDMELKKKFSEHYTTQFVDALKGSGLPPTKGTIAEMAKYISRSAKIGFEMTAQEAAKLVKDDIELAHRNLYGNSDAETLFKLLGEENMKKVREFDTSRLKNPNANLVTPQDQPDAARPRNQSKRMTPQEWRNFNRGIK